MGSMDAAVATASAEPELTKGVSVEEAIKEKHGQEAEHAVPALEQIENGQEDSVVPDVGSKIKEVPEESHVRVANEKEVMEVKQVEGEKPEGISAAADGDENDGEDAESGYQSSVGGTESFEGSNQNEEDAQETDSATNEETTKGAREGQKTEVARRPKKEKKKLTLCPVGENLSKELQTGVDALYEYKPPEGTFDPKLMEKEALAKYNKDMKFLANLEKKITGGVPIINPVPQPTGPQPIAAPATSPTATQKPPRSSSPQHGQSANRGGRNDGPRDLGRRHTVSSRGPYSGHRSRGNSEPGDRPNDHTVNRNGSSTLDTSPNRKGSSPHTDQPTNSFFEYGSGQTAQGQRWSGPGPVRPDRSISPTHNNRENGPPHGSGGDRFGSGGDRFGSGSGPQRLGRRHTEVGGNWRAGPSNSQPQPTYEREWDQGKEGGRVPPPRFQPNPRTGPSTSGPIGGPRASPFPNGLGQIPSQPMNDGYRGNDGFRGNDNYRGNNDGHRGEAQQRWWDSSDRRETGPNPNSYYQGGNRGPGPNPGPAANATVGPVRGAGYPRSRGNVGRRETAPAV